MESAGAIQHMNELPEEESGIDDKPGAVDLPRMAREISFDDVSFSYTGEQWQLRA